MNENIMKLMAEVIMLKEMLVGVADEEGELSDWAKESLAEARAEHRDEFVSLDELEREIENGIQD